jgi:hypothetical protein
LSTPEGAWLQPGVGWPGGPARRERPNITLHLKHRRFMMAFAMLAMLACAGCAARATAPCAHCFPNTRSGAGEAAAASSASEFTIGPGWPGGAINERFRLAMPGGLCGRLVGPKIGLELASGLPARLRARFGRMSAYSPLPRRDVFCDRSTRAAAHRQAAAETDGESRLRQGPSRRTVTSLKSGMQA